MSSTQGPGDEERSRRATLPRSDAHDERPASASIAVPDLAAHRGPVPRELLTQLQRTVGNAVTSRFAGEQVTLQRTTATANGGVFDNGPGYTARNGTGAVGSRVGAGIRLDFVPNDLVETPVDGISLIQTVRGVTNRVPGKKTLDRGRPHDDTAVSSNKDDTQLVGPGGVAVDVSVHRPGRDDANRSPGYGVGWTGPATSNTLGADAPTLGRTQRGAHVRDPGTGALLPAVTAQMEDWPSRVVTVKDQTFEMNFEVTALVTAGPLKDTYLGSIEWGWESDTTGTVTLKPFRLLQAGVPTDSFMGAAHTWNDAVMHDKDGTKVNTVDLPTPMQHSNSVAAVDMSTPSLLGRLPVARRELAGFPPGPSPERVNTEFEIRAMETELAKRKIFVTLACNSISDTGGAASPPEDEVWLSLDGGGSMAIGLTGTRTFRRGDSHRYEFALGDFMPMNAPLRLQVNEHDRAGKGGRESDDALVDFVWRSPFTPTVTADPDRHYRVDLDFDK